MNGGILFASTGKLPSDTGMRLTFDSEDESDRQNQAENDEILRKLTKANIVCQMVKEKARLQRIEESELAEYQKKSRGRVPMPK